MRCHVHENTPGDPVVGYVIGNDPDKKELAEGDVNWFISKFGAGVSKRHCETRTRHLVRGPKRWI